MNRPPCSPYGVEFASRIAPAKSSNGRTETSAPNTSSVTTFAVRGGSATTAGVSVAPWMIPPASSRAPAETASPIHPATRFAASASTIVPTSVAGSSGSPTRSEATCARKRPTNSSKRGDSTYTRCTEMQLCPELLYPVRAHTRAASARSASEHTIVAAFPPSSRTRRLPAAVLATLWPAAALPVNATALTSGAATKAVPSTAPPWRTCRAASGIPASKRIRTNKVVAPGACGGDFTIVVLPAANEAATLCASRLTGALNGVIARTTPTGKRIVIALEPWPLGQPSVGRTSPAIRRASAAAICIVSAARVTSCVVSLIGLPSSVVSRRASSSRRSSRSDAARSNISARRYAG